MAFKILKYVDSKRSSALGALRKRRRPSRWILCGAMLVCGTAAGETPGGNHASDAGSHWSFRQVVQPPVPTPPHQAWVRNPIDAFLSIQHIKHGLVPQEPALPYVLLRRIYMDLVGVPPTPEELADFTAQPTEEQKWSLKAMHRLMVTSTAYRMKSFAGAIMARPVPDGGKTMDDAQFIEHAYTAVLQDWVSPFCGLGGFQWWRSSKDNGVSRSGVADSFHLKRGTGRISAARSIQSVKSLGLVFSYPEEPGWNGASEWTIGRAGAAGRNVVSDHCGEIDQIG